MKPAILLLAGLVSLPLTAATTKSVRKAEASGPAEKGAVVTLDVQDEDIHEILGSMQKQCGIRNLVIDPNVEGKGTFFFRDVACSTAFDAVLESAGLRAATYDNSVVSVRRIER